MGELVKNNEKKQKKERLIYQPFNVFYELCKSLISIFILKIQ